MISLTDENSLVGIFVEQLSQLGDIPWPPCLAAVGHEPWHRGVAQQEIWLIRNQLTWAICLHGTVHLHVGVTCWSKILQLVNCSVFAMNMGMYIHTHTYVWWCHLEIRLTLKASSEIWLAACVSSQQLASVSKEQISKDNCACCHTETEATDETCSLTKWYHSHTGVTSPNNNDPKMPDAWQGNHKSIHL